MNNTFHRPTPSTLNDHDVPQIGNHLQGKRIALLVCGGIAAMNAPMVARWLRRYGAEVIAYASQEALKYVTKDTLEWSTNNKVISSLSSSSEHLSGDHPIDIYLVAPATYNTINKFKQGIADTVITTTLATALGLSEQNKASIFICPTMHGNMHNSILEESLNDLIKRGVHVISPRDDYGKHNIPDKETIVAEIISKTSRSSLRGQKILVTAGPTPVKIDNVRRITNVFTGELGFKIAHELFLRGAEVKLILGSKIIQPPRYISTISINDYDEYKTQIFNLLSSAPYDFGIFSAAVADYRPKNIAEGKIPSNGELKNIELIKTDKIIDLVKETYPQLKMISFKYEENRSHEQLMNIAYDRLEKGHFAVVANRGEEFIQYQDQVAYLVSKTAPEIKMVGKSNIADQIVNWMEVSLNSPQV